MHVTSEIAPNSAALFARNPYNTEYAGWVGFFAADAPKQTVTCDRAEFLGRNGTLRSPAAMSRSRLAGKVGAALDPCAAIQVPFELAGGQEREIIFTLGMGQDAEDATSLVRRFCGSGAARGALEAVWQYWTHTLGAVQVETPDASLDVLANGWLVYQVLACRLWGRSSHYQPGGAFGFRDQLQDVMALIHAQPRLVREQLLLCASRQFQEESSTGILKLRPARDGAGHDHPGSNLGWRRRVDQFNVVAKRFDALGRHTFQPDTRVLLALIFLRKRRRIRKHFAVKTTGHQRRDAPAVVGVAVAENQGIRTAQIDAEQPCIVHQRSALSGVVENAVLIGFDPERKSPLAQQVEVTGGVFNQGRNAQFLDHSSSHTSGGICACR